MANQTVPEGPGFAFDLSQSMKRIRNLMSKRKVSAGDIITQLSRIHPEYAKSKLGDLKPFKTTITKPIEAWTEEVYSCIDPIKIESLFPTTQSRPKDDKSSNRQSPHRVTGRQYSAMLYLLDDDLKVTFDEHGIYPVLIHEIGESFKLNSFNLMDILSDLGLSLYNQSEASATSSKLESVPSHNDIPINNENADQLGRTAFADYLFGRLEQLFVPAQGSQTQVSSGKQKKATNKELDGVYTLNLSGSWGSGKTSVLNLLHGKLMTNKLGGRKVLQVTFNAWRNQHIEAPWWSLMDGIYRQVKNKLPLRQQLKEKWWRLNANNVSSTIVFGTILLILIIAAIINGFDVEMLTDSTNLIFAMLSILGLSWAGGSISKRSLIFGGSTAAQFYADHTNDAQRKLSGHFNSMIQSIADQFQIVIFIDDLDRCHSHYAVRLLESIQTVFNESPIIVIVAADSDWLRVSYQMEYGETFGSLKEPGKSIGTLFMEKMFRFSTSLPESNNLFKQDYWSQLINGKTNSKSNGTGNPPTGPGPVISSEERVLLKEKLINGEVSNREIPFELRKEAVKDLTEHQATKEDIEHSLLPFIQYLSGNPRAMKILVNSYSANRALAILSGIDVVTKQLAIWTICSLRWPEFMRLLMKDSSLLERIRQLKIDELQSEIKEYSDLLFDNSFKHLILNFENPRSEYLQEETLADCSMIWGSRG